MYECSFLSQIPKKEKEIGFTKLKFFLLLRTLTIRLKLETFPFQFCKETNRDQGANWPSINPI